uniref:Uncharacterized protein n=1 Tax=Sphaerodactylus townsendi TaxID=933632 RepID=A0ACB8E8K6_9SAUR
MEDSLNEYHLTICDREQFWMETMLSEGTRINIRRTFRSPEQRTADKIAANTKKRNTSAPTQIKAVREAKHQQLLPNNTVDGYGQSNNPHRRLTVLDKGGGNQDYSILLLLGI